MDKWSLHGARQSTCECLVLGTNFQGVSKASDSPLLEIGYWIKGIVYQIQQGSSRVKSETEPCGSVKSFPLPVHPETCILLFLICLEFISQPVEMWPGFSLPGLRPLPCGTACSIHIYILSRPQSSADAASGSYFPC